MRTPLIILHNDKDGAVDFTAGIEYFNALRVPANQKDYLVRMRGFFAHHLKGEAALVWLTEGVPQLKIKDHLDERDELTAPKAAKPEPAPSSAN